MEAIKNTLRWIAARAKEPSTWAGIGALGSSVAQAYGVGGKNAAIGAAVSGALAIVLKEKARG